jgi:hypothetical protein
LFNSKTFFGTDGSLLFSDPVGFDKDVFTKYYGESGVVGRVTGVTVSVTTEIKAWYEIGSRAAKELRSGNIAIAGTIDRAYINGALLRLMLGKYAETDEAPGFVIPRFTMKLIADNLTPPGEPGNSTLTLSDVMVDGWQVSLPEDDFMLEHLSYKARRIAVADVEVKT